MRETAQRLVWILGLFCLAFGVVGVFAFSPVTIALAVTGWFLSRSCIQYLSEQGDIQAPSPDLQYWARTLFFRAIGLMFIGALIAFAFVASGLNFHLSFHAQVLLTALMIAAMIVVTKFTLPGFFAASWEIHGVKERRKKVRSSSFIARIITRAVAAMIVVTSLVGSFTLMQALRTGHSEVRVVADIAAGIFSPSEGSAR